MVSDSRQQTTDSPRLKSNEEAHSGEYSVKVGGKSQYAFQVKFPEIQKDMFVRATVWKKGNGGFLAFTSLNELKFQVYSKDVLEVDSAGWQRIILEAFVPANFNGEEIKLFVMNQSEEMVYFDDLDVFVYKNKPYPEYKELDNIDLIIDEAYINEINENRIKSFQKGVISNKTKKAYPAIFKYGSSELAAEVRIKGDWLDHIQGDKWSFRIKLLEGSFMGMREFSVQQPGSRGFLNEFVIHKVFTEEDILTPRYGFVPLKVNGKGRGIYAYEEHFAKHLIESRSRREGPIIKFDETGLWEINQKNLHRKENILSGPVVESAVITPFKKGKTMRNETLKGNFIIAQNLLHQYQYDTSPVSTIFKIKQLARFYALVDLGRSWHPLRWHNERYYYDPLSSKLEIIAYDCYTSADIERVQSIFTSEIVLSSDEFDYDKYLGYSPFNDKEFAKEYMRSVERYLQSDRINEILNSYADEIAFNYQLIKKEYASYVYHDDFLLKNNDELKLRWSAFKDELKSKTLKSVLKIDPYNYKVDKPLDGINLNVYLQSPYEIKVKNFHSDTLYLYAYSNKKLPEQGIVKFDEITALAPYSDLEHIDSKVLLCNFSPTKLYYKTNVNDTIVYNCRVNAWPEPELNSPRQNLLKKAINSSNDFCTLSDSTIVFKKGKHSISSPIIIPEGKKVIMQGGVHLDFINKAFFMSFSPVDLIGRENDKVVIESSDGTAMGFTIIDAPRACHFDHVVFNGFNTLAYEGWNLTGAVTFYESEADIKNTEFLNNHCEDALNIVRSEFNLSNSTIADAFADGFDADFAYGVVDSCRFERIGNDGIDFSGSTITIKNVSIDSCGDKGISGGESSTLYLENIDVENANIGVASKDRSVVNVKRIIIKNSFCAFAVYQKKSEYEPARMYIEDCTLDNISRSDLIGESSIIKIDDKERVGTEKINIDSLYGW